MKTSAQNLHELGCGSEIVNCQMERGMIYCAIHNAKNELKYFKYAVKTKLYKQEQANERMTVHLNNLKSVEHLVNKFTDLYKEDFCKIKLQIEKFIN